MSARLRLSEAERDALRRLGGEGYIGVVEFARGARGGRFRPVRTRVYRTEAGAAAELDRFRFKQFEARREVVAVDLNTEET